MKFVSDRAGLEFYKSRMMAKTRGYSGVYFNEDLTRTRSNLLFKARKLVKENRLLEAWTTCRTILIKDKTNQIQCIPNDEMLMIYLHVTESFTANFLF